MKLLTWSFLDRWRDAGLLFLRVGIGAMFVAHGWPKVMGGPAKWEALGGAMGALGITFLPVFWGFMASVTELGGAVLLIVGLGTRPAAALLAFTMFVAAAMHIDKGHAFTSTSHAVEAAIVFLAVVVLGAGKYSLDARLRRRLR